MKKRLLLASLAIAVIIAGVLVAKAASRKRSFQINKGTVISNLTNTADKNIIVSSKGKEYTIWLKKTKKKRYSQLKLVKECTKLKGNAFSKCKKASVKKIATGDKIKIRGTYYKAAKKYIANQIWFYTPPSSGY